MSTGHHEASWRLPESDPTQQHRRRALRAARPHRRARPARLGVLRRLPRAVRRASARRPAGALEPTVLLTAMAVATEHIGLIATASTTYNEPYNLARRFASLDHISGGRAGWNIVTTAGARGGPQLRPRRAARRTPSATRRADEFVEVVAEAVGQLGGRRRARRQGVGRVGRRRPGAPDRATSAPHFRVAGPLNLPRSPQGRPVLVQAGSSEDGARLRRPATPRRSSPRSRRSADAQAFYADIKAPGRRVRPRPGPAARCCPASCRPSAPPRPRRGRCEEELDRLIQPEYARQPAGRARCGSPRSGSHLDEQLPDDLPAEDEIEGAKSRYTLIVTLARRERLTVRAADRPPRRRSRAPHLQPARPSRSPTRSRSGSPAAPPTASTSCRRCCRRGLEAFVDHVVPILQAPRPVPHGVHGTHPARPLRPRPARPASTPPPPAPHPQGDRMTTTAPSAAPASRSAR